MGLINNIVARPELVVLLATVLLHLAHYAGPLALAAVVLLPGVERALLDAVLPTSLAVKLVQEDLTASWAEVGARDGLLGAERKSRLSEEHGHQVQPSCSPSHAT